jgi:hypothetical protein
MKLSLFLEDASCATIQELSSMLWNPKVHYRVHKSSSLVLILIQINPVRPVPSCLPKIHFNIINSRLDLPWSLSFWRSHQYPICIPLQAYSCYMPCPCHPHLLHQSKYIKCPIIIKMERIQNSVFKRLTTESRYICRHNNYKLHPIHAAS